MAKHSSHIIDMALKGAEHKYEELKAEIAALVKHFPHLAGRKGGVARGIAAVSKGGRAVMAAVTGDPTPKKQRKMSAKARKAISNAQKARWAKQKAATK